MSRCAALQIDDRLLPNMEYNHRVAIQKQNRTVAVIEMPADVKVMKQRKGSAIEPWATIGFSNSCVPSQKSGEP